MYNLMIVEDEPIERMGLRKIIERDFENINLLQDSKNGVEAIANCKKYRPNIILMDIRMPEMNGLEAQKRIYPNFPEVKTIILTACNDFKFAQESIRYGVFDYLLKPVRPNELKAIITSASNSITLNETEDKTVGTSEDILQQAINYIQNHYCEEINLNSVASYVHLNPQYFSRFFKKEIGVNFTEYVTKLRIAKAKSYLLHTDKPIYRIAVDTGFSDASYFSRVFCKYEQVTPQQFKRV